MTRIKAKACPWYVSVSWKAVIRGSGIKTFVLNEGCQKHTHELAPNPLSYDIQKRQAKANKDDILLYETDTFSLSPRPKNQHPAPSSMSSKPKLPPGWIYATESQETALSTRTNELPHSSALLPTTKTSRVRKEKKAWEQAKGNSQPKRRPRGPTLEETLVEMQSIPAPKKTNAKAKAKEQDIYIPAENIDERESQQQRILALAYMVDGGGAEEAEQADSELI